MLTTVVFCVELEEIPIVKGFEEFVFTSEGVPSTVDSIVVAAIKTHIYMYKKTNCLTHGLYLFHSQY